MAPGIAPPPGAAPASDRPRVVVRPLDRFMARPEAEPPSLAGVRIALAHDWLIGRRGGEVVLEAIVEALAEAGAALGPVFTLFAATDAAGRPDVRAVSERVAELPIVTSPLQAARRAGVDHRWLLPLYPAGVRTLTARLALAHARAEGGTPFDLLISTSACAAKAVRAPEGVPHLCYCHAPARYLWSMREAYSKPTSAAGRLRALGLGLFGPRLRRWDVRTAEHVDGFIANSAHTAEQIRRVYRRSARVIRPPIDLEFWSPGAASARQRFWLVVSALEPYKRVELAMRAAALAGRELVVAGDGSEGARLRALAASLPGVTMLGRVSDERLRELYRTASVLLFPQVEDFGIVAAEAQACGLPVAGVGAGGLLDIVAPGETGVLFEQASAEALAAAAAAAESLPGAGGPGLAQACRRQVLPLGGGRFARAMVRAAAELLDRAGGVEGGGARSR